MNFDIPPIEFSESEITRINEKYEQYLLELNDYEKRNKFIKSRQSYSEEIIKFRKKCYIVFCFALYNLLVSIMSLTLFKETSIIEIIICAAFVSFIPYGICEFIYELATENRDKRINEERNNLIKLYEKTLYEQYEKYIERYFKIQAYNKDLKEKQKNYIISIIKRISNMDQEEFKLIIKKLLEFEGQKISNIDIDKCLCRVENNHKDLILCKNMKRSISIVDIKKFENQVLENGFHCGIIYYTGDISTNAVNYCLKKNKFIFLYNEFDISERIYRMENNNENVNIDFEQIRINNTIQRQRSNNKCPMCGGNLVRRKGRYGKFLGCSNYPRCNYTRKSK